MKQVTCIPSCENWQAYLYLTSIDRFKSVILLISEIISQFKYIVLGSVNKIIDQFQNHVVNL